MESRYQVHSITSLYRSCNACGLPVNTCICNRVVKLQTKARLWILSTDKEFSRPSNTARLLNLINPESTDIHLWERTRQPEALLEKIRSGNFEPYLLFPAEGEEAQSRCVRFPISEKVPAFIIIDGTWQEARKIVRKSEYLKELPLISLTHVVDSAFDLRRGVTPGNLCTLEAAMEVLRMNGEQKAAASIDEVFHLFMKSYKAGYCGHGLKY